MKGIVSNKLRFALYITFSRVLGTQKSYHFYIYIHTHVYIPGRRGERKGGEGRGGKKKGGARSERG